MIYTLLIKSATYDEFLLSQSTTKSTCKHNILVALKPADQTNQRKQMRKVSRYIRRIITRQSLLRHLLTLPYSVYKTNYLIKQAQTFMRHCLKGMASLLWSMRLSVGLNVTQYSRLAEVRWVSFWDSGLSQQLLAGQITCELLQESIKPQREANNNNISNFICNSCQ